MLRDSVNLLPIFSGQVNQLLKSLFALADGLSSALNSKDGVLTVHLPKREEAIAAPD
jgi:hypothetical protein